MTDGWENSYGEFFSWEILSSITGESPIYMHWTNFVQTWVALDQGPYDKWGSSCVTTH